MVCLYYWSKITYDSICFSSSVVASVTVVGDVCFVVSAAYADGPFDDVGMALRGSPADVVGPFDDEICVTM